MALQGTLKDFGIADILQLIGQQQKSGVLFVRSKTEEAEVSFVEGQVVRARSKSRNKRELLGTMLVSSGVLTDEELAAALEIQRRTLKRLGDILVGGGKVSAEQMRKMAQLQTTETVYKLFAWRSGTYEFAQQDVEFDAAQEEAMRAETLLMEGFRRVDEWPNVQRRITSPAMTFDRVRHLDPAEDTPKAGDEMDDAFGELADARPAPGPDQPERKQQAVPKSIGRNERLLFQLADPEVPVRRLCEISQLGEFEASKALYNLLEAGFLKPGPFRRPSSRDVRGRRPSAPAAESRSTLLVELGRIFRGQLAQMGLGLFVFVSFVIAARALGSRPRVDVNVAAVDLSASRRLFMETQIARLTAALELYRLKTGRYPADLMDLADAKIVDSDELRFPFDSQYHYRQRGSDYVLLPPLN